MVQSAHERGVLARIASTVQWLTSRRRARRDRHASPETCELARYMQHECDDPSCQVGPTCRVDRFARWHAAGLGWSDDAVRTFAIKAIRSWQAFAMTKPRGMHPLGTLLRQHLLGMRAGRARPCLRPLDRAGFCTILEPPEVLLAFELPRRWPDPPPVGSTRSS